MDWHYYKDDPTASDKPEGSASAEEIRVPTNDETQFQNRLDSFAMHLRECLITNDFAVKKVPYPWLAELVRPFVREEIQSALAALRKPSASTKQLAREAAGSIGIIFGMWNDREKLAEIIAAALAPVVAETKELSQVIADQSEVIEKLQAELVQAIRDRSSALMRIKQQGAELEQAKAALAEFRNETPQPQGQPHNETGQP